MTSQVVVMVVVGMVVVGGKRDEVVVELMVTVMMKSWVGERERDGANIARQMVFPNL